MVVIFIVVFVVTKDNAAAATDDDDDADAVFLIEIKIDQVVIEVGSSSSSRSSICYFC